MSDNWLDHAACRHLPTQEAMRIFYPPVNHTEERALGTFQHIYDEARPICSGCLVQRECFVDAMENSAGYPQKGFRAGMSPKQRYEVWSKRKKAG